MSEYIKVCLFHETEKVVLAEHPIAVFVCLRHHFSDLLIREGLTQLPADLLDLGDCDFVALVVFKELEALNKLVLVVASEVLLRHQLAECAVVNPTSQTHEVFFLWLEAQASNRYLQLRLI